MKHDFKRCPLVFCALQMDRGMVHLRYMLDNRQAQTRSARLPGVAFVHPVEAFKHMGLMLLGNADACVGYGADRAALPLGQPDGHSAFYRRVLDGIVDQVVEQFSQKRRIARYRRFAALQRQDDFLLPGKWLEALDRKSVV